MPEQVAGQDTSWTQESVEKQAAQVEKPVETVEPVEVEAEHVEAPEKKERDKTDNLVSAVTELRAQRREALARANAYEQQNQQLARQQQELLAFLQQNAPRQQAPAPDDVIGQMQHGIAQTNQTVAQLAQAHQQQAAQEQQQRQWAQYVQAVKTQEAEFVKQQPDAGEAINFLKHSRVSEYKAAGLTHQEAVARMNFDERQLVDWAMQSGENPAKAAFDMAVARGYVGGSKKLEMQREGQSASMPSGGGGKGGGTPSLETLLKMDHKDFAKATEGDNWAKLLKKYS